MRKKYTLVELMVAVVILGIVMAASVPIYIVQVNRSRMTEAIAGLGAMRRAEDLYFVQYGHFMAVNAGSIKNGYADLSPGLKLDFVDNKYFPNESHAVFVSADKKLFTAVACGDGNGSGTGHLFAIMNQQGVIAYSQDGGESWDGDYVNADGTSPLASTYGTVTVSGGKVTITFE